MANQHHSTSPGKQPQDNVLAPQPTCDLCTWVFHMGEGQFWLKQIHSGCKQTYRGAEHRALATTPAPVADPLAAWLGAA